MKQLILKVQYLGRKILLSDSIDQELDASLYVWLLEHDQICGVFVIIPREYYNIRFLEFQFDFYQMMIR